MNIGRTPIEKAIKGTTDRRQRYMNTLPAKGLTYVRIVVPMSQVETVKAFAKQLRDEAAGAND